MDADDEKLARSKKAKKEKPPLPSKLGQPPVAPRAPKPAKKFEIGKK